MSGANGTEATPVAVTTFTLIERSKWNPGWKNWIVNGRFLSRNSERSGRNRMSRHWS